MAFTHASRSAHLHSPRRRTASVAWPASLDSASGNDTCGVSFACMSDSLTLPAPCDAIRQLTSLCSLDQFFVFSRFTGGERAGSSSSSSHLSSTAIPQRGDPSSTPPDRHSVEVEPSSERGLGDCDSVGVQLHAGVVDGAPGAGRSTSFPWSTPLPLSLHSRTGLPEARDATRRSRRRAWTGLTPMSLRSSSVTSSNFSPHSTRSSSTRREKSSLDGAAPPKSVGPSCQRR